MDHPTVFRPEQHAVYSDEKMGKSTLFSSERIMVGLNAFEAGQEHKLHAHKGMDKVYGAFLATACLPNFHPRSKTISFIFYCCQDRGWPV